MAKKKENETEAALKEKISKLEITKAPAEKAKTEISAEDETPSAESKAEQNSKEDYVEYCLPFLPGKKKGDSHTVTINGKNYQVQYGVNVKVPIGVKEILEEMVMQTELIDRRIRELTDKEKCIAKFE